FVLLALNTWELSQLTLTTTYGELTWLLIIRGAALGCALQPTQLVALAAVPDRLLANASSLNNALRNVFSSFGIALLGTVIQSATVTHVASLSQEVTPTSSTGQFLTQISALLQAHGLSAAQASTTAMLLVLGQIERLAAVLAFGDAYRVTFFAALVALALSFLLPGRMVAPANRRVMGGH
ncbi:MAG TPA: hypothetical protein VFZ25_17335, partial [Chloroflexota bacterium]|nr:hypothetical protein [Chloroflexota bacterium]